MEFKLLKLFKHEKCYFCIVAAWAKTAPSILFFVHPLAENQKEKMLMNFRNTVKR